MLVVRAPARLRQLEGEETWTTRGQRVVTLPAEHAARPDLDLTTTNNRPDTATARLLLAHAHRARHLLADRAVLANVQSTRRSELMQELHNMRRVMRVLEEQVVATTRSLEAMERLVEHLRRVTDLLPRIPNVARTRTTTDSAS